MASIAGMSPIAAGGLGLVMLGVNAKNISLAASAASTVAGSSLPRSEQVIVMLIWAAIGSLTAIIPTIVVAVEGDKARPALERGRDWLLQNNAMIMFILFTILGVSDLGKALSAFTA